MPIAALAAPAIGAISAGVGLATGAASVFTVAGAVGGIVGTIGAITGNKALSIAGGALGAVGGLGAVASSAGVFGEGGLFGSAAQTAGATGAGSFGATGAGELGGLVTGGPAPYANVGDLMSANGIGSSIDVLSTIGGTSPPAGVLTGGGSAGAPLAAPGLIQGQASSPVLAGGAGGDTLGIINTPSASPTPTPAATANPAPVEAGTAPGVPKAPQPPAAPGSATGPYSATLPAGAATPTVSGAAPPVTVPTNPNSTWSGIFDWLHNNQTLALAGASAIGSFLSGAFNPVTPAQTKALEAQAARNQAETGLINAQTQTVQTQNTNMAEPIPGATRTRTNTGTGGMNERRGLIDAGVAA